MSKLKLWPTTSQDYTKSHCVQWMLRIIVLSICLSVSAAEAPSETSSNYLEIYGADVSANNQITLYCWLGSESCYILETILSQWATNNAIPLLHVPLIKRPHWRRLAKARLVAQQMDVEEELVQIIGRHLFQDKQTLESDEALFQLLEDSQISATRFANIFYAAETNQAINLIQDEAAKHRIRGIPSVVINNKWLVDASMQRTGREMISTIEQLLGLPANGD